MDMCEIMEKKEGLRVKEIKISLPLYKILCAFFFVLILAIVRGVTDVNEIGPTIDTYIAILALVLCADTCYQEVPGGGWEILAIKPKKQQRKTILRRFAVQYLFIICVAAAGYGLFYIIQQPYIREKGFYYFAAAMGASAASIVLFGAVSALLSKMTGSLWGAIGASAALWFFLISSWAEKLPPFFQIFAFGSRNMEEGELWWITGKVTALILGGVCMGALGNFSGYSGKAGKKGKR